MAWELITHYSICQLSYACKHFGDFTGCNQSLLCMTYYCSLSLPFSSFTCNIPVHKAALVWTFQANVSYRGIGRSRAFWVPIHQQQLTETWNNAASLHHALANIVTENNCPQHSLVYGGSYSHIYELTVCVFKAHGLTVYVPQQCKPKETHFSWQGFMHTQRRQERRFLS